MISHLCPLSSHFVFSRILISIDMKNRQVSESMASFVHKHMELQFQSHHHYKNGVTNHLKNITHFPENMSKFSFGTSVLDWRHSKVMEREAPCGIRI